MTDTLPAAIDPRLSGPAPADVRQLVVCCDGTNNTLTGGAKDTNVLLTFEHLDAAADPQQRLYYDPGVGSPDSLPATGLLEPVTQMIERAVSLAVGRGIYENIGQAYLFLCREYRRGDQVYLFGFSRGAFTVRCVAGMVNMFGLIRPEHEPMLATLLRIYFAGAEDNLDAVERGVEVLRRALRGGEPGASRKALAEQVRRDFTSIDGRDAVVFFVGVWDTVESVGIRGLRKSISNKAVMRSKRFVHVRHALSLDEHRYAFLPRYYDDRDSLSPGQTLAQRWFRGVHSDVGGGIFAGQSGLSLVALDWMLDEARAAGLRCAPAAVRHAAPTVQVHDRLHASPWWAVTGMALRRPEQAPGGNLLGLTLQAPSEHPSVAQLTPQTLWAQWRSWGGLVFALLWCAVWLLLSGTQMQSLPDRWRLFDPGTWGQAPSALSAGLDLARAQFAAVWPWITTSTWQAVHSAQAHGAAPRAALALDLLFIAGYAYLLARLSSRAFAWLARWRRVGDPMPWWNQLRLGQALPLMLLGDLAENLFGVLAFSYVHTGWQPSALLWLGSVGALAKWLGLLGVAMLVSLGWRGKRHPEPHPTRR